MSLVINHNFMAANAARNLNNHYGQLATSTQRLSSGLRINGAADDAAGLAIRELMRADVAALHQGVRNANDAISMIQVTDGALAVIDEKLIRMKELAEQAATGTYDSMQRLMIDSEFQAMASEIQRIATATDFNGVKLIDGKLLQLSSSTKINEYQNSIINKYPHFTPGYMGSVYEDRITVNTSEEIKTDYLHKEDGVYKRSVNTKTIETITEQTRWCSSMLDAYFKSPLLNQPLGGGEILNPDLFDIIDPNKTYDVTLSNPVVLETKYEYINNPLNINHKHQYNFFIDVNNDNIADFRSITYDTKYVDPDLVGNDINYIIVRYDPPNTNITTDLTIEKSESIVKLSPLESGNIAKIHFGPMNDAAEDYYDIEKRDCTLKGLGIDNLSIETQDKAQNALVEIDKAIVKKDQARAYYGAMQNRLENTVSNLTIQAENLQAAESRISDVDVATEMTNFVRYQILTQSAVAMLGQANSLPQMAMQLIGG